MSQETPESLPETGPERLAALVDRHAGALTLYARQLCASAEDVVQEALVELCAQATWPAEPVGWLYGTVRNKARAASRAAARRRQHEDRAARHAPAWFVGGSSDSLDRQTVRDALATLEEADREVIVARLWGGLSFEAVGQLIGTSDSTAHRRYVAALGQLRDRLGARAVEE